MTKHVYSAESPLCGTSHYVAIVEAQKEVEVYQLGDLDCLDCLRRMVDKHAALADVFRLRLVRLSAMGAEP